MGVTLAFLESQSSDDFCSVPFRGSTACWRLPIEPVLLDKVLRSASVYAPQNTNSQVFPPSSLLAITMCAPAHEMLNVLRLGRACACARRHLSNSVSAILCGSACDCPSQCGRHRRSLTSLGGLYATERPRIVKRGRWVVSTAANQPPSEPSQPFQTTLQACQWILLVMPRGSNC